MLEQVFFYENVARLRASISIDRQGVSAVEVDEGRSEDQLLPGQAEAGPGQGRQSDPVEQSRLSLTRSRISMPVDWPGKAATSAIREPRGSSGSGRGIA